MSKKPRMNKWEKRELLAKLPQLGFHPVEPQYRGAPLLKHLERLEKRLESRPPDRILTGDVARIVKSGVAKRKGKYVTIFGNRFLLTRNGPVATNPVVRKALAALEKQPKGDPLPASINNAMVGWRRNLNKRK